MIDVVAIPNRLEDPVGETQDHNVLDRLLAEEMIHSIDLRFRQHLQDTSVQRTGGGEICAEWFFNDDTTKAVVLFLGETGRAYLLDNRTEQLAGNGKVENC